MNVGIISIYSFPKGLAPTNRILAYSSGMIENGANVTVYMPFPTDNEQSEHNDARGIFKGITYNYTSGRYKSNSKIVRALGVITGLRKFIGFYTAWRTIRRDNLDGQFDCIIISTDQISVIFVFSSLAKMIGARSIFIFDEFPIPIRHKLKDKIPFWKECLFKWVLKRVDGYISISETLSRYFCNFANKPTFILSSITDVSRFINSVNSRDNEHNTYLCYMGNMELAKDDVDNIINAFALIATKYPQLTLRLYGNPNSHDKRVLEGLAIKHHLTNRVLFMGKACFEEVPYILCNAKLLVSSQPNTVRASGGFPTKLGEYLASGVPSLLTDVGENAKYVKDGVHVFFVEPQNVSLYAKKMEYILDNYPLAKSVSRNGQQYLIDNFSNTKKGMELFNFVKGLVNGKH